LRCRNAMAIQECLQLGVRPTSKMVSNEKLRS
jgi:hypothetical protein